MTATLITTRAVESASLKVGKSLKIGKKSDKMEIIGFDLDYLANMPKCHCEIVFLTRV